MYWEDQGFILSKTAYNENSIILEAFTENHGKCSGIVYGGLSRKHKKNFQIANKILLNWKSKGENRIGYFTIELLKPLAPMYFDDRKKTICFLAAASILRMLLPDRQINKTIFNSFESLTNNFHSKDWIRGYIFWELSLIKELGYEIDLFNNEKFDRVINDKIEINDKFIKVPNILLEKNKKNFTQNDIKEALAFNRFLILENFIKPFSLTFPLSRNILEQYF